MKLPRHTFTSAALLAALSLPFSAAAQTPAPKTTKATPKTAAMTPPTDAEIADAKSKGQVWVNTGSDTKAYHKADDKYFGKTKKGKFMAEADAQKAGYHLAKESPIGKKKAPAATPPATPAK
jgi:hypothetical protein